MIFRVAKIVPRFKNSLTSGPLSTDFNGFRRKSAKSALRGAEVSEFLNHADFLNKIHYAMATQNRNQISKKYN